MKLVVRPAMDSTLGKALCGVAQGAATSPVLSNLVMNEWVKRKGHGTVVAYADDSVSFSDHPIRPTVPANSGIAINMDKSGYVKFEGKWLRPLRFLGLEFDGKSFYSNTRKGKKAKIEKTIKSFLEIDNAMRDKSFDKIGSAEDVLEYLKTKSAIQMGMSAEMDFGPSWEELFKSKFKGHILARLYSGSIVDKEVAQDFAYDFVHGS